MKLLCWRWYYKRGSSPPTRAEWIEMVSRADADSRPLRSPPTRAEWIEISIDSDTYNKVKSPPTRAEWIEI